jgi:imidazolonepropionase-like amidohydrolase/Tol biopolymer transport system component
MMFELSRRTLLQSSAAGITAGFAGCRTVSMNEATGGMTAGATSEATWTSIDITRDGRHLLFTCLGHLHRLDLKNGSHLQLTSDFAWYLHPALSPDGRRIAVMSDRDGSWSIWTCSLEGTAFVRESMTEFLEDAEFVRPIWSRDGELHYRQPGSLHRARSPHPAVKRLALNSEGSAAVSEGQWFARINGRVHSLVSSFEPRLSANGQLLAYAPVDDPQVLVRLVDLRLGTEKSIPDGHSVRYPECAQAAAFGPAGRLMYVAKHGRLFEVSTASLAVREIPFSIRPERNTRVPLRSRRPLTDRETLVTVVPRHPVMASGRAVICSAFAQLWKVDIPTGSAVRLTDDSAGEVAPALSPDGRRVAYARWTDRDEGSIAMVPAAGGRPEVMTTVAGRYINPAWSSDGKHIAFIFEKRTEPEATSAKMQLQIQTLSLADRSVRTVADVRPSDIQPDRIYPRVTFAPGGDRIFVTVPTRFSRDLGWDQPGVVSYDLQGEDRRIHLRLPPCDDVVVSPDVRQVAICWREHLYVADVGSNGPNSFDPASATPLSKGGPHSIAWCRDGSLTWMEGTDLLRNDRVRGRHRLATLQVGRRTMYGSNTFAIVNARILTMRGDRIIEDGVLLVRGRRIVQIAARNGLPLTADIPRIDAGGATVIPGLIDTHSHPHSAPREVWPQQNSRYLGMLAYGVTTMFDAQGPNLDSAGQAEMVEIGSMTGPRVFSAGRMLHGAYRPPGPGLPVTDLSSPGAVQRAASHRVRRGEWPLKEYWVYRRRERQWVYDAARSCGVTVTSHPDSFEGILTRVADGYPSIEHGFLRGAEAPVYRTAIREDAKRFLGASGTFLTPTLGATAEFAPTLNLDDPKLRRFVAPDEFQWFRRAREPDRERIDRTDVFEELVDCARHGARLSTGGHSNGPAGLNTHWEMWAFVLGGLSPMEALRSATVNGAEKLGIDADVGTLEAGRIADFLILGSNPLDNIRNSADIRLIVKDGIIYNGDTLDRLTPAQAGGLMAGGRRARSAMLPPG